MAGYWAQPDATRDAIDENGWLRSGNTARIDDEGYIWIVDRVDDAYEGQVVSSIPATSNDPQRPAVADAGVAARDGADAAFVVLTDGQSVNKDELLELVPWATLAAHEVPSSVMFLDRLPRSSVGKLLRHELTLLPLHSVNTSYHMHSEPSRHHDESFSASSDPAASHAVVQPRTFSVSTSGCRRMIRLAQTDDRWPEPEATASSRPGAPERRRVGLGAQHRR